MSDKNKFITKVESDPYLDVSPDPVGAEGAGTMNTMVARKTPVQRFACGSSVDGRAQSSSESESDFDDYEDGDDFGSTTAVFKPNKVIVGRYVMEELLGAGGMGTVVKARCLRLGKHFAIKRMHQDLEGDEVLREFFYREARLASSLAHPNIVSVVDFGEDPGLGAFMVMELAQGKPLSDRIRAGSVALRTTCEILLQIAVALQYIHEKGIVHGDIKPENILLDRLNNSDGRRWNVTLLDFGLARLNKTDRGGAREISGTPPYMAPERINGIAPKANQDLYSLGVLAYQLITGHLPFDGTVDEVLKGHLEDEPPPFSDFLDEEIDERVEQLIRKALRKDPEDRHPNMSAFIYEMRTLMSMLGVGHTRARFKKSVTLVPTQGGLNPNSEFAAMAFDLCPLPVAMLKPDGTITVANRAFARFARKNWEELANSSIFVEPMNSYHCKLRDDLEEVCQTGQPLRREVTISNDAETCSLRVSLTPGTDPAKHTLMLVQVAR